MGRAFGKGMNYKPINKLVYFGISPMEQKAYTGALSRGVPNLIRRVKAKCLFATPVICFTIWLMRWADRRAVEVNRKQPGEFDHEV